MSAAKEDPTFALPVYPTPQKSRRIARYNGLFSDAVTDGMTQRITVDISQARTPGLFRLLAAILYDSLLVVALLFLAMALVVIPLDLFFGWEKEDFVALGAQPLFIAYLCGVPTFFFLWFWIRGGQTLGMRSWRIRAVRLDGGPLELRQAALRLCAALLSWAALGLGFLWVLVDRQHFSWHDRLSGTRLVMTRK